MKEGKIPGGFILLSRMLLSNGIMEKPPLYLKLWIWMLLQASHSDHGELKRGQFFTSLLRMRDAMKYRVGASLRRPTIKEIRGACHFLSKGHAIVTTKVTHGLIITILNYEYYQDWTNYEGQIQGQTAGNREGTILTKKGNKEGNNTPEKISEKISTLKTRYQDPILIERCIVALASVRKSNRIADSVVLAQLEKWSEYPPAQVETAIRTYLNKGCAADGKGEAYLLGILRKGRPQMTAAPAVPEWY